MHSDLNELGWTDEHWNRISGVCTEEAHKGRVAARLLPLVGPEDPSTIAVPRYALGTQPSRLASAPPDRLWVDSDPNLFLTTISVNVQLHLREAADPELTAALGMFRRAANYIARLEDALVINGRAPNTPPPFGTAAIPAVTQTTGNNVVPGLMPFFGPVGRRSFAPYKIYGGSLGDQVFQGIVDAINKLETAGQLGPFGCLLSPGLFAAVCTPNPGTDVLPRDRILPLLQGPLLRSSAILPGWGAVVALSANPVELVVASDIHVRYLQTTAEPRLLFRVSERVALRIKEPAAIALLF
jgi:uncharacterized linocin/CFP29 family protein